MLTELIRVGPHDANMQLSRGALPGRSSSLIMASKQIPEEPGKNPDVGLDVGVFWCIHCLSRHYALYARHQLYFLPEL